MSELQRIPSTFRSFRSFSRFGFPLLGSAAERVQCFRLALHSVDMWHLHQVYRTPEGAPKARGKNLKELAISS